jgi:hypothetical protein
VSGAEQIAQVAIELVAARPYFGGDEMVLPSAEAVERLDAYRQHRQQAALAARRERRKPRHVPDIGVPAEECPAELANAQTIGLTHDETDGLSGPLPIRRLRSGARLEELAGLR